MTESEKVRHGLRETNRETKKKTDTGGEQQTDFKRLEQSEVGMGGLQNIPLIL